MKMISMSVRLAVLALVFASGCCCPGRCYNACYDPCGAMNSCASLSPCGGCGGCDQCAGTAWDDTCDWTMDCIDNSVGSVGNQCGKMKCKFRSNCKSFWAALGGGKCGCNQCSSGQSFDWLSQSGNCGCGSSCGCGTDGTDCGCSGQKSQKPMSPPKCQSCQAKRNRMMSMEDDSTGFAHIGATAEGEEYVANDMQPYYPMVQAPPAEYMAGPMMAGAMVSGPVMSGPVVGGPMMGGPMMPAPVMSEVPAMAPPMDYAMPVAHPQGMMPGPYPVSSAMPRPTPWRAAERVPAPPAEEEHSLVPSTPISGESPVGTPVTTPVQGEAEEEFERPLILQQNFEGAPGYGVVPAGR